MPLYQSVESNPTIVGQYALPAQNITQRDVFLQHPGVHRVEELLAGDEVHLQGEKPEDHVAVS
jgi:hypothetical protein